MAVAALLSRFLVRVSALALAGFAIVMLVRFEGTPAHAGRLVPDPPTVAQVAAVHVEAPVAPAEAQPEGVVVPDFTGKRLGAARREAKKLGLKLIARDEYGERVLAELGPYYRVRKQRSGAGSPLAPGSVVEVRVRPLAGWAEGY